MDFVKEKFEDLEFIICSDIISLRDAVEPLEKINSRSVNIQRQMKLLKAKLKEMKQIAFEQDSEKK